MPLYKFECDHCGERLLEEMSFDEHDKLTTKSNGKVIITAKIHEKPVQWHGDIVKAVGACGVWEQVFDFQFNRGMVEHYSDQLDMHVSSERHFNSELSRQQDEYSARMGFDVNFETVDPSDTASLNVTDAGLESQERARHNENVDGHKSVFS